MKIMVEIIMKDGTIKHEVVEANNYIEVHQKMHKKYKGQYNTTLIETIILK